MKKTNMMFFIGVILILSGVLLCWECNQTCIGCMEESSTCFSLLIIGALTIFVVFLNGLRGGGNDN